MAGLESPTQYSSLKTETNKYDTIMAIINCPECSKEISDKSHACPQCGSPNISVEKHFDKAKLNEVLTYKPNKRGLIGILSPSKYILDWISFHDAYFEIQRKNGTHDKFDYLDCKITYHTQNYGAFHHFQLESKSSRKKVKFTIVCPDELQKGEIADIAKRLNANRITLLGAYFRSWRSFNIMNYFRK